MDRARVLTESRGDVRILTLNRPDKLNAADLEMQRALLERLEEIAADGSVRGIVVTGAGRAFCAGGDYALIKELAAHNETLHEELSRINAAMLPGLLELDIPVVAAVNGPAVGFGASLVALCDIVVMAEGAFLSDPHVKYGMAAAPGCELVWPHLTSRAIAKELLMSARRVEAPDALRLGLANHVCPRGTELDKALELLAELGALPPSGVTAVKRAFNKPLLEELRRQAGPETVDNVVWVEKTRPAPT